MEITLERINEVVAATRFAGELFDGYARHHLAKSPPDIDKAQRNIEAATKMFDSIDEPYNPPEIAPARDFGDWKNAVQANSSPVQRDSGVEAAGSAGKLLSGLHIAEIGGEPTLGVDVHLDDQPILATLIELGFLRRDDVSDKVTVTTDGKDAIGVRPDGVPDLPVEVQEVTGNIEERELAARYIESKVGGVERWLRDNPGSADKHDYEIMARVLAEIAHEFRKGFHLPEVVIEGRVIPYNEDRSSGLSHADALRVFFTDVHERNVKAGWWTNIETGEPLKRNVGEMFMLMVTEIAEAFDAYADMKADDKLPHQPGVGVEIGDLLIRAADFCGGMASGRVILFDPDTSNPGESFFKDIVSIADRYESIRKTPAAKGDPETCDFMPSYDVAVMVDEKLAYNAKREDHKIENRLKPGGKIT